MTRAESTRIEATHSKKAKSRRSHSTAEMLKMSLDDLRANNKKGVTLQAIKKYISVKFDIDLRADTRRYNILKNSLKALLKDGLLVNLNSKGLVGHLRYMPPADAFDSKNRKSNAKPTTGRKRKSKNDTVLLSPVISTQPMNTESPPAPRSIDTSISEDKGDEEPSVRKAPLRTRRSRAKVRPPTLHSMLTETPLSSRTQDTQTSEERKDGYVNNVSSPSQPTTQPKEPKKIPSKRRLFEVKN